MSETQPRPSHTTLAVGLVIGGSVGVVIGVAEQLSGLHSLETRESVSRFLSEPPGSGLGLDVTGALAVMRVALMVVAGCATAAAVLGYHVLRRSHRARVGLSLLAVPIFVGGLAAGGFLTSLVAAASLLLWVGPSGAWFRGEPTTPPERAAAHPGEDPPDAGAPEPFGRPPEPGRPEAPAPQPLRQPPPYRPAAPAPAPLATGRRPDALIWACVLTWALCSVVLTVLLVSAVLIASDPALVLDELRRQGREIPGADLDLLRATTYVTAAVAGVWSVGAMVIAAVAYRGRGWARLALVLSAAAAAALCLLASLSTLLTLIPGVVCLVVVVMLNRPDVRAWCDRT